MNITGNYRRSKCKRHLEIVLGKMLQPSAASSLDKPMPYIRAANVQWGRVDWSDLKEMWFSPSDGRKYTLEDGDLVVLEGGDVGRCAILDGSPKQLGFQNSIHRVRVRTDTEIRFVYYWMAHLKAYGYFDLVCSKATLAHFTGEKFAETPFPVVDLATQRQIADFLDRETARIDLLIEKKQRLVALLGEKFEATISRYTSPPSHDFTGWVERPIKALCTIFGRIGFRGYTTEDIVEEGEGAVTLSPSNIRDGRMTLAGRTYLSWKKYNESPEIQVAPGDIVFVKTGSTIGKVAKVDDLPEPMTLNPQLVVLKKVAADPAFLLFAMQSRAFQYQVSLNRFGGSTPAMSQGHLGRLRVWLPEDNDEQRKRAELILLERDRIDAIKLALHVSIDRLKEYRSALITTAVTGQIDVQTYGKSGAVDRRIDTIQEEMEA